MQAPTAPTLCPYYRFTRTLRLGSTGEDVRALQKFLNCAGFTLASGGPGSPGNETPVFAQRTYDALIKFQETYRSEVLAPINASKSSGIFAQYSKSKAYSLMEPQ
jgi:peptidoglycan hydrolase-like protein with peptidoglycan-binding domain